jgi:rare lipoprotein A (peptidoglycan hydrolase)
VERRSIHPRPAPRARRRRSSLGFTQSGPRPDLIAAWAVALGIFLVLVASATSEGASGTGGATAPVAPGDSATPQSEAATKRPALKRMRVARATWYGPGLYGNRTACGIRLRPTTLGVAHKRLPCGTRVTFFHRGRYTTAPVIDRGPFARGLDWDLTAATARELGFRRTGRLRVIH